MNLHDLINLKNRLQCAFDLASIESIIEKNSTNINELSLGIDSTLSELLRNLAVNHSNLKPLLYQHIEEYKNVLNVIEEKITDQTKIFFTTDYQANFPNSDNAISAEFIERVRIIESNDAFENVLKNRINLYSNWQFPCLEIGCRNGEYTKYLVASDPLYIADSIKVFLNRAVDQFTDIYQGRVRKYLITDYCKIDNLPTNQFGLIFSYNFFNYLSFESIKDLLSQAYAWLRPGGTIVFTYNNGDLPAAAAYAENKFMTYVPKKMLLDVIESIGFETIFSYDADPAFSLIEIKKPGNLKSIKLGQTLGEIRNKK
jgi:SAM-dependent methyltransferase